MKESDPDGYIQVIFTLNVNIDYRWVEVDKCGKVKIAFPVYHVL